MDSNVHSSNIQVSFSDQEILSLPPSLKGFVGRDVSVHSDQSQTRQVICFSGVLLDLEDGERICPVCGHKMHVKGTRKNAGL